MNKFTVIVGNQLITKEDIKKRLDTIIFGGVKVEPQDETTRPQFIPLQDEVRRSRQWKNLKDTCANIGSMVESSNVQDAGKK